MKRVVFIVMLSAITSCSEQSEKSYTVSELLADPALLANIIGECRNNPGELAKTPNCQNAESADGKLRLEQMRKSLGG